MIALRVASISAAFVMSILVMHYMPSWRECLVFAVMWVVAMVCNIRVGQLQALSWGGK